MLPKGTFPDFIPSTIYISVNTPRVIDLVLMYRAQIFWSFFWLHWRMSPSWVMHVWFLVSQWLWLIRLFLPLSCTSTSPSLLPAFFEAIKSSQPCVYGPRRREGSTWRQKHKKNWCAVYCGDWFSKYRASLLFQLHSCALSAVSTVSANKSAHIHQIIHY